MGTDQHLLSMTGPLTRVTNRTVGDSYHPKVPGVTLDSSPTPVVYVSSTVIGALRRVLKRICKSLGSLTTSLLLLEGMFTSVSHEGPRQSITASLLQDGSSHVQPGRNSYLIFPWLILVVYACSPSTGEIKAGKTAPRPAWATE